MEKGNKMTSFSKGAPVKLNVATCFTEDAGGERKTPLTSWHHDNAGVVFGRRAPTSEELEDWRNSPLAQGLDSAGETKLPPRSVGVELVKGTQYTVARGRARMTCTWGNPVGGYVLVEYEPGRTCFVKRELLTHA